jgi:hypothetical protein
LQFDNVHLRRDNPNVPSDLEQIPSLLHFLENEGTLLTNHHTPLIAHTSVDILTSLTAVYGEKMGMPIGNTILLLHRQRLEFHQLHRVLDRHPANAGSPPGDSGTPDGRPARQGVSGPLGPVHPRRL